MGFPDSSSGKEPAYQSEDIRDVGLIPGLGRYPGGEHGNPLQYSCLETPHGQRSLKDYSSQGRTELDMTAATQQHKTLILNSVLQFYLFHIINLRCVCFAIQPGL